MTTFLILIPIFVAVAVYLVWHSRRSRQLVSDFARARNLQYRETDDGQLAAVLDEALGLEQPGLVRSFGQIRDIVHAEDNILLFRTVELLDLSPHGSGEASHCSRVGVTFEASERHDAFVLVYPDLQSRSRLGSDCELAGETAAAIRGVLEKRPPRCPLSVTLKRGRGLIYLEPRVTGSVRSEDLDYLIATGRALQAAFVLNRQED